MRALAVLALAGGVAAQPAAVDFATEVLPLLERHCIECHRAPYTDDAGRVRNPKAGLRLDGRAWIEAGGDGGEVVVAGQPAASPLWLRTTLPAGDSDRMPKNRDPLTTEQQDLLRSWIEQGAAFGDWHGAPGPGGEVVAADSGPYPELAKDLTPLPEAVLAKARAAAIQVQPLAAGSPLLRVGFAGHPAPVTDRALAALAPLSKHVAVLSLARTQLTDRALHEVGRWPRLAKLDLRETAVTAEGIAGLANARALRSLNLFATPLRDDAVPTLVRLPSIEVVYVWQTGLTANGIAALQQQRPLVRVVGAPELPLPAAEPEPRARRRR